MFEQLKEEIHWRSEKIKIFGKQILQPRLTAWYGDPEAVYTYSGLTMRPELWTPTLQSIREKIQGTSGKQFNSVLLNYYRTGDDYMGWHSDNEKELGKNPTIASLSLGGVRKFQVRHRKDKSTLNLELANGSLLLMGEEMQKHWIHKIAATKRPVPGRINLTFRNIHSKI